MAVYSMGSILKKCREAKGITQEELCLGICTPSALSKIEHGYREPSYVKFASLMERMGEWPEAYDIFVGDKVYAINELQDKVRTYIFHQEFEKAEIVLGELEKMLKAFPDEVIYHQFLNVEREICKSKGYIRRKQIAVLEEYLKWTVPCFGDKPLEECFLSHQELVIINNIAIGYGEDGEYDRAIDLFGKLKAYLKNNYIGNREKAPLFSSVLTNSVKYLGLGGYYEEALKEADEAIGLLVATGRTLDVALMHYDIAWIYYKMENNQYKQKIEDELVISIYTDLSNCRYHSAFETIQSVLTKMSDIAESISFRHCVEVYRRTAPEYYQKLKL